MYQKAEFYYQAMKARVSTTLTAHNPSHTQPRWRLTITCDQFLLSDREEQHSPGMAQATRRDMTCPSGLGNVVRFSQLPVLMGFGICFIFPPSHCIRQ